MNDTTSTPDEPEPDGHGRVATGEQVASPQQAAGAGAAPDDVPEPAAAGSGTNGAPSGQPGATAPQSDEADARPGASAEQSHDGAAGRSDGAAAAVAPGGSTGAEAPTAQLDMSGAGAASESTSEPAAGQASTEAPTTPAQTPAGAAASPDPRPLEPDPAPGPIPGPGPGAAAPPPWNRMSGPPEAVPEQQEQQPPPEDPGGFLDEGPTAFLEPPSQQDDDGRGGGTSSTEPGGAGWSTVRAVRNRPPRQAVLQLKRFDPWSALKLGLVLSVVLFFIWLVAVSVLYGALDGMGVWDRLNGTYADLVSGETPAEAPLISAWRVLGFATVIGAINSLLFAVAVTVGAFIYNVSADVVGGIEVTLSERD